MRNDSPPINSMARAAAAFLGLIVGVLGTLIALGAVRNRCVGGLFWGLVGVGFGSVLLRVTVGRWNPAWSRFPWRGLLAAASWIVWPMLYFAGYLFFSLMFSTRGISGDPPQGRLGILFFLGFPAVPAFVTYRWLKWRRVNLRRMPPPSQRDT